MRSFTLLAIAGLGLGLLTLPASAHHSTIDIYDDEQVIEITGEVTLWRFVNPHPYLVLEVTGPDGQIEEWDVSFGGSAASALGRRGYSAETFEAGEVVIVRGNPARVQDAHGVLVRGDITREDGTPVP